MSGQVLPVPKGFIFLGNTTGCIGRVSDVIGVITDSRPPIPTKGTDYTVTFNICDTSVDLRFGTPIRIFRPTLELLPQIHSDGDVILLRRMKISSFRGQITAMSTPDTSWAILYRPTHPGALPNISLDSSALQPMGQENEYMKSLYQWWALQTGLLGHTVAPGSRPQPASTRKSKFALIRDMEFDRFYDIVGYVVKTFPGLGNFTIYITDYSRNTMLHAYEWGKGGTTSMGGDGDSYDSYDSYDPPGRRRGGYLREWPGPWGQYTLQVTLWDIHAEAAKSFVFPEMFVRLQNVRARRNGDGKLEGALHGDRKFIDRVDVHALTNMNDPQIREVLQRKTELARRFESDKVRYEEEMQGKAEETKKKEKEKLARKDEGNKYVRCQKLNHPITPISQIINPIDSSAPFVNRNYRIYCRVIDYLPKNLEDFSVQNSSSNSPKEESGDENQATNPWTWRFALLVQGKDEATMRVIVDGKDAEYLLRLDAVDLRKNARRLEELREKLFLLWGSLEERTSQSHLLIKQKQDYPSTTSERKRLRKRNKRTNSNKKLYSCDELGKPIKRDDASGTDESSDEEVEKDEHEIQQGGKMFQACVKEYGVSVGQGWKRLHKLFGTVIM